jgi:tRNA 5-methylaminomethyl-2-thiouridine biosynthesis bifunctional protein
MPHTLLPQTPDINDLQLISKYAEQLQKNKHISMANISWLENGEPYSEQFKDIYFSTADGLAETEYVFLKHNHFPHRFSENRPLTIGETGFGSGLNFLVTAYHWLRHTSRSIDLRLQHQLQKQSLQFISVEKYPFTRQQLHKVYQTFIHRWPCLNEVCDQLMAVYPEAIYPHKGDHTNIENSPVVLNLPHRIRLVLLMGDAATQLESLSSEYQNKIDAWYLDGFAPAKNNSMWTPALFNQIARLSHPQTTLSTFTAAGEVRRGLTRVGFKIKKARGFAHKREMLYGKMCKANLAPLHKESFTIPG